MFDRWSERLQSKSEAHNAAFRLPAERYLEKITPLLPDRKLVGALPVWTAPPFDGGTGTFLDVAIVVVSAIRHGGLPRQRAMAVTSTAVVIAIMPKRRFRYWQRPFRIEAEHGLGALGPASGDVGVELSCAGRTWFVEVDFADEARRVAQLGSLGTA